MSRQQLVLDTNIMIDLLKKSAPVVAQFLSLLEAKTTFLLSPIVVAEVYAGAFEREYKDIEVLFSMCECIAMDAQTGRVAGMYAKQFAKAFQGISLEDYLLAATARVHGCALWTHNKKHYPMDDITLLIG
jgi:predicted nucleic acid-binding protein